MLEKSPFDPTLWISMGAMREIIGDFDGAKQAWQWVETEFPKDPTAIFNLASMYATSLKDYTNSEKEYLKAIEIKPDYSYANYNLGVMYFNSGNEWNEKLNKLPLRDPKTKEYETKSNDYFKKAVTYFEKAYEVSPDKATKQRLRQLLLRLGETEKADKYK